VSRGYVLSIDELVRSIGINRETPLSLFLGAGASITSGIPSAAKCIWLWKRDIFLTKNPGLEQQFREISLPSVQNKIQRWLDTQGRYPDQTSSDEYGFFAEACYPIGQDRRKYFEALASKTKPHLGYKLLAALAESGLIRAVWTTNFDSLVPKAMAVAELTVIEVSLDTPERVLRPYSKGELVHVALHGDYRYDALKNTDEELQTQDRILRQALEQDLVNSTTLVCGYSGRDDSVMQVFSSAYSRAGTGKLFWCGFDNEPSQTVLKLIERGRHTGRAAYYVQTSGFDDLMTRLALHCLDAEKLNKAKMILSGAQHVAPVLPFRVDRGNPTAVIKSNALPLECPSEILQFDQVGLSVPGAWSKLRSLVAGKEIVAALQRGKVIALGRIDDIKAAFGSYLAGEIQRIPLSERELAFEDGPVVALLTEAVVQALSKLRGLKTDGRELIWSDETSRQVRIRNTNCRVYQAALISLRRYGDKQHLIIKPTVVGRTQEGAALDPTLDKELKRTVLTKQWNREFNTELNEWRKRLFPDGNSQIPFPDAASSTRFSVRTRPAFAKIYGPENSPRAQVNEKLESLLTQSGIRLKECRLVFANKSGSGFAYDTQPVRGIVQNRPFDYSLTTNGFNPEIRVGVICPAKDSDSLSTYLKRLHQTANPDSKAEYLLPYPGFVQAFGVPISIPEPNERGWVNVSDPAGSDLISSATELAQRICQGVQNLQSVWNPHFVLVYVPQRWQAWESIGSQDGSFDLHDFVKAYCVQQGIASQFLRENTLAKPYQCEVVWWLALSFYVKAMRTPWVLDAMDPNTAFVGLGYSLDQAAARGQHVVLGCSHLYSSEGLGLRYRLSKVESPLIRHGNPFMSRDDARRTGENIRQLFFESTDRLPNRVVIHKRTQFLRDEKEGLLEGLAEVKAVEMLEITIEPQLRYVASRVSSQGTLEGDGFPVKRGTVVRLDDRRALVWVHGSTEAVDGRRTYYQGKSRIPAPLLVTRHYGSSSLDTVGGEVLGLSKMNWNTFDLYTKLPATLQSSGQIAKIGSHLERFGPASYDYRLFI
jgi:hypothetical protein